MAGVVEESPTILLSVAQRASVWHTYLDETTSISGDNNFAHMISRSHESKRWLDRRHGKSRDRAHRGKSAVAEQLHDLFKQAANIFSTVLYEVINPTEI